MRVVSIIIVALWSAASIWAEPTRTPREALQPFNDLIGAWKGTGIPEGTREEQQRGFWIETLTWEWRFKDSDAWLAVDFQDGKHFRSGELRFLPAKEQFQLTLHTAADQPQVFTGKLEKRTLTLLRDTPAETQRLTFRMLHENRFLYSYAIKPAGKSLFLPTYQVGVTKKDGGFAQGSGQPECIVSGGLGTMTVTYQGRTFYVCCSGCRDEFLANPQKYIKEFEAKKPR